MKKLKIGIIGAGVISKFHIEAYNKLKNVEIISICDIKRDKALNAAKRAGIDERYVFTDFNEMMKLDELDAVSVCNWNCYHAPAAIAALNAGKHVLCEKPMATNAVDAIEMEKASQKSGKLLMVGFARRFSNEAIFARDFIQNGLLGDVYYAKASYLRRIGNPGGWFCNKELSGGGALVDLGVHIIDLVQYMLGKPKVVKVSGATFNKLGRKDHIKMLPSYGASSGTDDINDVEDLATAMIRYENGTVLTIETSFCLNSKSEAGTVEIYGSKGGAKLFPVVEFYTDMNNYAVNITPAFSIPSDFQGVFDNEISHFIDCITNGTPCISPAEDGVSIMRILDAIYESARTGEEVTL